MYSYKTSGVCSSTINIDIEDNIVKSVEFVGGCAGNLLGIGSLVKGMTVDEVIAKFKRAHLAPSEMEKVILGKVLLEKVTGDITISLEDA